MINVIHSGLQQITTFYTVARENVSHAFFELINRVIEVFHNRQQHDQASLGHPIMVAVLHGTHSDLEIVAIAKRVRSSEEEVINEDIISQTLRFRAVIEGEDFWEAAYDNAIFYDSGY